MQKSLWQWRRSVESPWFYAAWFCLFGAVMLLVAHGKYGERQADIERRFQARSIPASGANEGQTASTDSEDVNGLYSTPEDTVIPLWPLAMLLVVLALFFGLFAVRAGHNRASVDAIAD